MESTLNDNQGQWKTFTDWILDESHDDNNFYQIRLTNIENMKALLNRHKKISSCRCFFCNCLILKAPPSIRFDSVSPRPFGNRVPFNSMPSNTVKPSENPKAETQTPELPSTPKPTTHAPRKPLNKTLTMNVKTQHAYQGSVKKDFVKSNITAVRTTPKEVKTAPKKTTLEEKAAPKKTTTVEKATTTKTTVEGKAGSTLKRATSSTILNSADEPEVDPLFAALNKRSDLQIKQNQCYLFPPTPLKTAMPNIKMTGKETTTKTTVERKAAPKLKRASSTVLNSADEPEFDLLLATLNKFRDDPILSPPATPETANAMPDIKMAEEKATTTTNTKVEGKAASKLKRVASSTIPKSNSTNGAVDNKETLASEKQNQQEKRFDQYGGTPTLTLSPCSSLMEEVQSINLVYYNLLTLGAENKDERNPCQQSENKP